MRSTVRLLRGLAPALALALVSGCSSAPKEPIVLVPCEYDLFDPPAVVERGLTSATVSFPFNVTNPNPVPIRVDYMNLEPTINEGRMGREKCGIAVEVPAGGTRKVEVAYQLSYISAGVGVIDAIVSKQARIEIAGTSVISNASPRHVADPLEHPITIR